MTDLNLESYSPVERHFITNRLDKPYKMRWYYLYGENAVNLAYETFHDTVEEMQSIQLALYHAGVEFMSRPTMWEKIPGGYSKINDIV